MDNKSESKKEEDFEGKVKKLIDTFIKAEKLGKENSIKYKNWIKEISDPNFKLISNLSNYFLDDYISTGMRENIFKIMRKLYYLNPKLVGYNPIKILLNQFLSTLIVEINQKFQIIAFIY